LRIEKGLIVTNRQEKNTSSIKSNPKLRDSMTKDKKHWKWIWM